MAFPDIKPFENFNPGPYELQMGSYIGGLLRLFAGRLPDGESFARVSELISTPDRWSAGHAVFDEVRHRLLRAMKAKEPLQQAQYCFEKSCCQATYNATSPSDAFDPSSPFFVVGQALALAKLTGVPLDAVAELFMKTA